MLRFTTSLASVHNHPPPLSALLSHGPRVLLLSSSLTLGWLVDLVYLLQKDWTQATTIKQKLQPCLFFVHRILVATRLTWQITMMLAHSKHLLLRDILLYFEDVEVSSKYYSGYRGVECETSFARHCFPHRVNYKFCIVPSKQIKDCL